MVAYVTECLSVATDNVILGVGWAKGSSAEKSASMAVEQCKISGGKTCNVVTYCNR